MAAARPEQRGWPMMAGREEHSNREEPDHRIPIDDTGTEEATSL